MNLRKSQWIAIGAVLLVIAGMNLFVWRLNARAGQIFLLSALAFLLIGGLVLWLLTLIPRRNLQNSEKELQSNLTKTAPPAGKQSDQEKIEAIRRKFNEGFELFKSTGRNVYSVPWYLVIGESGSGKTEAIRHSSLPFPANLNNYFQGVGGTFNMNWWFSNRCVLLDTAGRMVLEQHDPTARSEWGEFLNLLRKARSRCPINGLLLFIPVDTLICDSAEKIREKTARLHFQLRVIQKNLKVRFPVYVVVAKADRLIGFREWVASWPDQSRKGNIFGWSNPHELDEQFNPDWIEEMYQSLLPLCRTERDIAVQRLVKTGQSSDEHAPSDLTSAYALPNSLSLLRLRLKYYLENIFVHDDSPDSVKLPFLRGIYFTSAMTEGAVLDADLSEASGQPADEIADSKVRPREVSYFLADLFSEKIFPEGGMVVSGQGSVKSQFQLKQGLLAAALLLCCGGISYMFLGMAKELNQGVSRSYQIWAPAHTGWTSENYWNPLWIGRDGFESGFEYRGGMPVTAGGRQMTLVGLQQSLVGDARLGIAASPYALGRLTAQSSALSKDMRDAQVVLVRRGVVGPLLEAARKSLGNSNSPWGAKKLAALVALIELERQIVRATKGGEKPGLDKVKEVFEPLALLVSGKELEPSVLDLIDRTFHDDFNAFWSLPEINGGKTLAGNSAIEQAISQLQSLLTDRIETQSKAAAALEACAQGLVEHDTVERELIRRIRMARAGDSDLISHFDDLVRSYRTAHSAREKFMAAMKEAGFEPAQFKANLTEASKLLVESRQTAVSNEVRAISTTLGLADANTPLEQQIGERLEAIRKSFLGSGKNGIGFKNAASFPQIDASCLRRDRLDRPAFAVRFEIFQQAVEVWSAIPDVQEGSRVPLGELLESINKAGAKPKSLVNAYLLDRVSEVKEVVEKVVDEGQRQKILSTVRSYAKLNWRTTMERVAFPITIEPGKNSLSLAEIVAVREVLGKMRSDLEVVRFSRFFARQKAPTEALIKGIDGAVAWIGFLAGENRDPLRINVRIPQANRQQSVFTRASIAKFDERFAGAVCDQLRLRNGVVTRDVPRPGQGDVDLVVLEQIPVDQLMPNGELTGPNGVALSFAAPPPYFFLTALAKPGAAQTRIVQWDDNRLYWVAGTSGTDQRFFAFELVLSRSLPARELWPTAATLTALSESLLSSL